MLALQYPKYRQSFQKMLKIQSNAAFKGSEKFQTKLWMLKSGFWKGMFIIGSLYVSY